MPDEEGGGFGGVMGGGGFPLVEGVAVCEDGEDAVWEGLVSRLIWVFEEGYARISNRDAGC